MHGLLSLSDDIYYSIVENLWDELKKDDVYEE